MKKIIISLIALCFVLHIKAQYNEEYIKDFLNVANKIENSECRYIRNNGVLKRGWVDRNTNELNGPCYVDCGYYKSKDGFFYKNKLSGYGTYVDTNVNIKGFWHNDEIDGYVYIKYYIEKFKHRQAYYYGYWKNGEPIGLATFGVIGSFESNYLTIPESGFIKSDGSFVAFKDSLVMAYAKQKQPNFVKEVIARPMHGRDYYGGYSNGKLNGYGLFVFETKDMLESGIESNYETGFSVNDSIRFLQAVRTEMNDPYNRYGESKYLVNRKYHYEKFETNSQNIYINEFIEIHPEFKKYEHTLIDEKTGGADVFYGKENRFHQYKTSRFNVKDGYELLHYVSNVSLVLWKNGEMKEFWCMDGSGGYVHVIVDNKRINGKTTFYHGTGIYVTDNKLYNGVKCRINMSSDNTQYEVFADVLNSTSYKNLTNGELINAEKIANVTNKAKGIIDKFYKFDYNHEAPNYPDWEYWVMNYSTQLNRGFDMSVPIKEAESRFNQNK